MKLTLTPKEAREAILNGLVIKGLVKVGEAYYVTINSDLDVSIEGPVKEKKAPVIRLLTQLGLETEKKETK